MGDSATDPSTGADQALKRSGSRADSPTVAERQNRDPARHGVRRGSVALALALIGSLPSILVQEVAEAGPNDVIVTGRVWRDDDQDSTIDANEYGLGGITVRVANQRGDLSTSTTAANGTYSITVDRTGGPKWRVEVAPSTRYEAAPLTAQNLSTVQFLTIAIDATGTINAGNTALVDRRFVPAALACYSAYVTNYSDNSVRRFGTPDPTTGLGAQQQPLPGGNGSTAWVVTGGTTKPMGLAVGPEGDVWVGEEIEGKVSRYDGDTGAPLHDIASWKGNDTRAVTFGLDGRIYIADNIDRRVYWYDPVALIDGIWVDSSQFDLAGGDNREPEMGLAWRGGHLYVSTGPAPGKVMEFNSNGAYTGRLWTLNDNARGMAVGSDGLLYVAAGDGAASGAIWRINPDTNTATNLSNGASMSDIEFGPDGSMFVVEDNLGKIRRYAMPSATPMNDFVPASGTVGYSHSQPRSLVWWRGTNACPSEVRTYEIANRVWSDVDNDGVQDPSEPGIPTVTVSLFETGADNNFGTGDDVLAQTSTTDHTGMYRFSGLPARRYEVRFSGGVLPWASVTTADSGGNDRLDSDVATVAGRTKIEVTTGPSMPEAHSFDAGFRLAENSLGGYLFDDANNNGLRDSDEGAALPQTAVRLLNNAGATLQIARTDSSGRYSMIGVPSADLRVRVGSDVTASGATWRSSTGTPGSLSGPYETAPDADNDTANIDDGTFDAATGHTDTSLITIRSGTEPTNDGDGASSNQTIDLGFFRPVSIGDRVWSDDDRDGVQDAGEGGVVGTITVQLRNAAGATVATTTTAVDGSYRFNGVSAGTYSLRFVVPSGFAVSPRDVGSDVTDSDLDSNGVTPAVTYTVASTTNDVDAGLIGASVGDRVFIDSNDNGRRDALEAGFGGVPVQLLDENATRVLNNTTTAVDGSFRFRGLPTGNYRLRVPFDAVYQGVASGYVSSVGFVANHSATSYEPAPDPDNDIDDDDNGSADWTTGHITTEPITATINAEPTADDGDPYTNLSVDFGLHQPEGVAKSDGYYNTVLDDGPLAYYRLGDASAATVAADASGFNRHGSYVGSVAKQQPGAVINDPNQSVSFGGHGSNQRVALSGLPVNTAPGAKTTVEFWMYWTGTQNQMPFGFTTYDLWIQSGRLGFNGGCSDVYGVPNAGLANRWVHVTAVFTNNNTAQNKLYIDGASNPLGGTISCNRTVTNNSSIAIWTNDNNYTFGGRIDEVSIYNGELSAETVARHYTAGSGLQPPPPNNFTISTFAGTGVAGNTGDGGPSTNAAVNYPSSITTAPDGTVYFTNWGFVRKVATNGIISTVGTVDSSWNGITVGPDGFLYVAEYSSCVIRRINPNGGGQTVWAGAAGTCTTTGDGGTYVNARFNRPMDLAFDPAGNLYVSEYSGARIRKIAAGTGIVTTFSTAVSNPWGIDTDAEGNVWVVRWGSSTGNIYKITPAGTVTGWVPGVHTMDLVVRDDGAVYFVTYTSCSVRRLLNGVITSVVNENGCGYGGDGGSAAAARLSHPASIAYAGATLYVADRNNFRVRRLVAI